MSKAFEEISAGLGDAIKHAKGHKSTVVVHEPETINVKAIRAKTGMSQQRFCATFGISLAVHCNELNWSRSDTTAQHIGVFPIRV